MREVEMARKVDIAVGHGRAHRANLWQPVARLYAAARCWLAARQAVAVEARSVGSAVSPYRQSLTGLEPERRARQGRPTRAGDPYAGMILVAHAGTALAAAPPPAVTDHNRAA